MHLSKVFTISFSTLYNPLKAKSPDCRLLRIIGEYVTKILRCFGCIERPTEIGFPSGDGSSAGQNVDQILAPYLKTLAIFRADIRNATKGDKSDLSKQVTNNNDLIRTVKDHPLRLRFQTRKKVRFLSNCNNFS